MARTLVVVVLLLVVLGFRGDSAHARTPEGETLRVLFVGNSYTRFNVLPQLVRRLGRSREGGALRLAVEAHARPGYSLRKHWQRREARQRIRSGRFSHVVLQDHSLRPLDHVEEFEEYVTRFKREADRAGSRTVLYETWPRQAGSGFYRAREGLRDPSEMRLRVGTAYLGLAEDLGARLAPVGLAFFQSRGRTPGIDLYRPDGAHPSWAGSFLAACVLYGAITGADPRQTAYHPWEVQAETASALRRLASEVLAGSPEVRVAGP